MGYSPQGRKESDTTGHRHDEFLSKGQSSSCSASLHMWKVAPQDRWQFITGQETLGSTGMWQ